LAASSTEEGSKNTGCVPLAQGAAGATCTAQSEEQRAVTRSEAAVVKAAKVDIGEAAPARLYRARLHSQITLNEAGGV
jgi:hypothetical protein